MARNLIFWVIVAFFMRVLACIFEKGDVRAGFRMVGGEIFIEAKERTKPVQTQEPRDDQKTVRSGLKQ